MNIIKIILSSMLVSAVFSGNCVAHDTNKNQQALFWEAATLSTVLGGTVGVLTGCVVSKVGKTLSGWCESNGMGFLVTLLTSVVYLAYQEKILEQAKKIVSKYPQVQYDQDMVAFTAQIAYLGTFTMMSQNPIIIPL